MTAAELTDVSKKLQDLGDATEHLVLIERVDLQPGFLTARLDKAILADRIGCLPEQINLAEEAGRDLARRDLFGPTNKKRHPMSTFPSTELKAEKFSVQAVSSPPSLLPGDVEHTAIVACKND